MSNAEKQLLERLVIEQRIMFAEAMWLLQEIEYPNGTPVITLSCKNDIANTGCDATISCSVQLLYKLSVG